MNESVADALNLTNKARARLKSKLSCIIRNGSWHMPTRLRNTLSAAGVDWSAIPSPSPGEDMRVWKDDEHGKISVSSSYNLIRTHRPTVPWHDFIWSHVFHPRDRGTLWKIVCKCVGTDDRRIRMETQLVSRCSLCFNCSESSQHLFWECSWAIRYWSWVQSMMGWSYEPFNGMMDAVSRASSYSSIIKEIWFLLVGGGMLEIWRARNDAVWRNNYSNFDQIQNNILKFVNERGPRLHGHSNNIVVELNFLHTWGLNDRTRPIKERQVLTWELPVFNQLKLCTDGSSLGNSDKGGAAAVIRNHEGNVLAVTMRGLGIVTNFRAELEAIMLGMKWAATNRFTSIWLCSDSATAINACLKNSLPWDCIGRWRCLLSCFVAVIYSIVKREVNFSADAAARVASTLIENSVVTQVGQPHFISEVEQPYTLYHRN